jgi:hypothetical protein
MPVRDARKAAGFFGAGFAGDGEGIPPVFFLLQAAKREMEKRASALLVRKYYGGVCAEPSDAGAMHVERKICGGELVTPAVRHRL